ncbi:MAG TPA: AMIN domain-containing protein [Blastocatellia bacterium]|nr:AMIN domain-containing protein [Blastocatellia bacterium]
MLRSVRTETSNGALQIIVDTDGAVQFKDFILNGPTRIVVDLAGVRSTMGSRTIEVASGLVDRSAVDDPLSSGETRVLVDYHYRRGRISGPIFRLTIASLWPGR